MAITPILVLLGECMENIDILTGVTNNVGATTLQLDIDMLKRKWGGGGR